MVLPTGFEPVTYFLEGNCSDPIELQKLLFCLIHPAILEPETVIADIAAV